MFGNSIARTLRAGREVLRRERRWTVLALVCALHASSSRVGGAVEVRPGELAPTFAVASCLGGDAASFEVARGPGDGRVTLLTWWDPLAPRSGDLRRAVRLAERLGDTVVLALAGEGRATTFELARRSVPEWADVGPVSFGWDDGSRTRRAFLGADHVEHDTVVVDRSGRVAWSGDLAHVAEPLTRVVDGTWEADAGSERSPEFKARMQSATACGKSDPARALVELDRLAADFPLLEAVTLPARFLYADDLGLHARVRELGLRMITAPDAAARASDLLLFTRHLVDPAQDRTERYLDLADAAASIVVESSEAENAEGLALLAQVRSWQGNATDAVALQERALACAPGRVAERFESTLAQYRATLAEAARDD